MPYPLGMHGVIDPVKGLRGHWKLNETSGTIAADSIVIDPHNGTLENGVSLDQHGIYFDGTSTRAMVFDGADDRINLSGLNLTKGNLTISLWVRPLSLTSTQSVFGNKEGGADGNREIRYNSAGKPTFFVNSDGGSKTAIAPDAAIVNVVNFLLAEFDTAAQEIRLTVNNGTPNVSDISANNFLSSVTGKVHIGDNETGSSQFTGTVDDVRYYNKLLTTVEKTALYENADGIGAYGSLLCWWKFDKLGNDTLAIDTSINGQHGDINGASTDQTTLPKLNEYYSFDGNNDSVSVTDPGVIPAGAFSISFWARSSDFRSFDGAVSIEGGDINDNLVIYPYQDDGSDSIEVWWNNEIIISSATVGSINTWNHFCFTSNGSNDHELFLNGSSVGTSTASKNLSSTDSFTVGEYGGGSEFYLGDIDDVRLYDKVLNGTEIAAIAAT